MDLIKVFVEQCIVCERQSRLLFEFSSPKKRGKAIDRFSHGVDSLIKKQSIVSIVNSSNVPSEYFEGDLVVLSYSHIMDTKISCSEAKEYIQMGFGPIIIISSVGKAIIKTEDFDVYLLKFDVLK